MNASQREIGALQPYAERWSPQELLSWVFERFHPRVALASGFGAEGVALIDMALRCNKDFRVFTLDTGFLFPETYALMNEIECRYGLKIERCHPELTPAEQARAHGEALWSRDPDLCCDLRKVRPLAGKLLELDSWVSAIRREQSPSRANARKIEWDEKFGVVKINPLAAWRWEQVWEYVRTHKVPYNPLHDRNYPSLGCTHCTQPVQPGEDLRAGRWPGFAKIECGIHGKT